MAGNINNLGIGFVPFFYAKSALINEECFEVKLQESLPSRSVCIVQDAGRTLTAAAKELFLFVLQALLEHVQSSDGILSEDVRERNRKISKNYKK